MQKYYINNETHYGNAACFGRESHRDLLGMGDLNFTEIPGEVDT